MASTNTDLVQDEIWVGAIGRYKDETGHNIDDKTVLAELLKLQTPDDLLHFIESKGEAFKNFRQRHGKVWLRIKQCLYPIANLSEASASIMKNTGISTPAAIVLGSAAYLIMASHHVSEAYDWVQTAFAELEEFTQRLSHYASSPMDDTLKRKVQAILASLLRIIGRAETLVKRKRFYQYLNVTFLGKDEQTKGLVEDLNKQIANEQRMVVAITLKQTNQASALASTAVAQASRIEEQVLSMSENIKDLQTRQTCQVNQQDLDSMASTLRTEAVVDTDDKYSLHKRALLSGSGTWLEKEPFFESWLQRDALILCIFGGPGSGKTMLSTWLTKLLLQTFSDHSDVNGGTSVGFFYIREDKEGLRNPNLMLKTMAWQILQTDEAFKKHAASACTFSRDIARAEDTWDNLFLKFYQSPAAEGHRAILIIDGLDEAADETRHRLLNMFKAYITGSGAHQPQRIQLAIFGRTTLRSDLHLTRFEKEERIIQVSREKNQDDLSNYILDRIQKLAVVQEMSSTKGPNKERARKFIRGVQKQVLVKADGIFLWAQLILDQMKGKDEGQIRKLLKTPPQSLEDMIYSVLKRISQDPELDVETTARILTWVSFSRRPLKFGELDVITRLASGTTNWMLWPNMTGKFASIFRLRYPKGYDPDAAAGSLISNRDESTMAEAQMNGVNLGGTTYASGDDESDNSSLAWEPEDVGQSDPGETEETLDSSANTQAEADKYYDWYKKNTIVEFTHVRFRDVAKIEGNPQKRQREPLSILMDMYRADISIVLDSLEMMRTSPSDFPSQSYYLSYPTFNLFAHLTSLDQRYLEPFERETILDGLYWLLHDEQGCRALFLGLGTREGKECDEFWRLWFHGSQTTRQVQHWFKEADTLPDRDIGQISWMRAASESARTLVAPLARTAAKMWLTKSGFDDMAYLDKSEFQVWFLKAYMALGEDWSVPDDISNFIWAWNGSFYDMSSVDILPLAEWAQLEKTTHWYTGVGWILWEASEVDSALEMLEKAIELDSEAWVALEAKARVLALKEDYRSAINTIKTAISVMPQNLKNNGTDSYLLGYCSGWLQEIGEDVEALEMIKHAYYESPNAFPAMHSYIQVLGKADEWRTLMDVVRYSDDLPTTYGHSIFVQYLTIMALFRYQYYDQDEQSMKLLEDAMERLNATDPNIQRQLKGETTWCIYKLAQMYFDAAVQNHRTGHDTTKPAGKLEKLATVVGTGLSDDDEVDGNEPFKFYAPTYPSLLWGRWLRDYARADETVWKKCFRSRLLEQMNGLDDDDPTNDTTACTSLAISLFQAGDELHAASILAILFKPMESYLEDKSRHESQDASKGGVEPTSEATEKDDDQGGKEKKQPKINKSEPPNQGRKMIDQPELGSVTTSLTYRIMPPTPDEVQNQLSQPDEEGHEDESETKLKPATIKAPSTTASSVLELHLEHNSWRYTCNGCGQDAEDTESMWFCEICYDVNFCTSCLDEVKEGRQERRQCNPNHKWHQAWPIPKGRFEDMAKRHEHGDVTFRKGWLKRLRSEWLIDQIVKT